MRTQLRSSAVDAFVTGILEWSIHRNNEAPLASRPELHSRGWWNPGPIIAFFGFVNDGVNGHKKWWRRRELCYLKLFILGSLLIIRSCQNE